MKHPGQDLGGRPADFDVAVVGASLAGCSTSILLGRAGLRVALVEKRPDPEAFKRVCSHFIHASAVPTLERLYLLDPILTLGGVRSRIRAWTRWGWIEPPIEDASQGVNMRREVLDPLMRRAAGETPGVELLLGRTAQGLVREDGAVRGVIIRDRQAREETLRARLVVGADGRDSRVAELAGVPVKTLPHGRFSYGAYFDTSMPAPEVDGQVWLLDPHWAGALPTDSGLVFYVAMLTKDRLPEFKRDPERALTEFVANLPNPPPIREQERVGSVVGKIEMPNRVRRPVAPGLALVGDAALATDPLFSVGCGWALQSGEWLADSVTPALEGAESLRRGLARYRRHRRRRLWAPSLLIHSAANGRPMKHREQMVAAAAARDPELAARMDAVMMGRSGPLSALAASVPRAIQVNARHALGGRPGGPPPPTRLTTA